MTGWGVQEGGEKAGATRLGHNGGISPPLSRDLHCFCCGWHSPPSSAATVKWHHADSMRNGKAMGQESKSLHSNTSPATC